MKKKSETTREFQPRGTEKPSPSLNGADIVQLILRDHMPLKALLETLKDADKDRSEKESSFEEFVPLLVGHAKAEEQSLYVQMKDEGKGFRVLAFEGDTEHGLTEQLVHEINGTADDDEWNAKVKVLAELVEHHIREEEEEMLPDVETKMAMPTRQAVGAIYNQLKTELDLLRRDATKNSQDSFQQTLN